MINCFNIGTLCGTSRYNIKSLNKNRASIKEENIENNNNSNTFFVCLYAQLVAIVCKIDELVPQPREVCITSRVRKVWPMHLMTIFIPLKDCSVLSSKICAIFCGRVKTGFYHYFRKSALLKSIVQHIIRNKSCQKLYFEQLWLLRSTSKNAPFSL